MACRSRSGIRAILVGALLASGGQLLWAQTATNLRTEGVVQNPHVLSHTPVLCWDYTGNQTNWHIQSDDDPNYQGNSGAAVPGQIWYWDSGDQDKGALNDDRCATFRQVVKPGFVPITLDRRAHRSYWRLRIQVNGIWGPWVETDMRMNQYPLLPANVAVASDGTTSSDPALTIPARITGRTFYVSPTGNDSSAGTQASPFRTIARGALALTKGDTLLLRGGIYTEYALISSSAGHQSGERNNPITIKAFPGETPILRAPSSGTRTALELRGPAQQLSNWIIDGVTIGGASTTIGIHLNGVVNVTVRNIRMENTWTTWPSLSADGILITGGSEDCRVLDSVFDQKLMNQVHVSGARHTEIRGNEFTNSGRMGMIADGGDCPNMIIADNNFHDASPDQAMLALYIGTQGTRVVNNVFANVILAGSSLAWGILELRSGEIYIENNVFYNVEGSGVNLREWTSFGVHRNNIFMQCGTALHFVGGILPGSATDGAVADYNIFYQNSGDIVASASEIARFAHPPTGNCMNCNPLFVNAGTQDFRVMAGSPAIDAGDPGSPVPVGGGARVDIGRFEVGASGTPYAYQPRFSVQDATPRITWDIVDVDNSLEALFDDLPPGDVDFQTKYQIQIDTLPTFDSVNQAHPMLDSGLVTSLVEGYTVPSTRSLPPGDYYVRVRQVDDHETQRGAWSDNNVRFRVVGEPVPPYLAGHSPAPGAAGVLGTAPIVVHVKDDGVGVNQSTIRMFVNGAQVTPSITGTAADYTLSWTPSPAFAQGTTVTVRVTADDNNQSPPGLDSSWTFSVRDNTPPQPPTNVRFQ